MKTVKISLNPQSIREAIAALQRYKESVDKKMQQLKVRVAEELGDEARKNFAQSVGDVLLSKDGSLSPQPPCVQIEVETGRGSTLVIAKGKNAIFIEFGAGVFYNGPVGSSPHPSPGRFTIGSYGPNAAKRVWGFSDEDGVLRLTRGVAAQMPMYNALMVVSQRISAIAKEVFSHD